MRNTGQVYIRAIGFKLTESLRAHVRHRLRLALWRFQARVARIGVRLSDLNDPHGGVQKACRLRIRLHRMPDIWIEDAEEDLYVAIGRAADRAGRMLRRRLQRRRSDFGAAWKRSEHEPTE